MIRVGDLVEILSGDDKGVRERIGEIQVDQGRVVVNGVNKTYKHVKRSQRNPRGGRLSVEGAIDRSKVALVCSKCNRGVRVRRVVGEDGSDRRLCRRCGGEIV